MMSKLTDEAKEKLPLLTRVRLHFASAVVKFGFKIMPSAYYEDLRAEEIVNISKSVQGVECELQPEREHEE